VLSSEQSTIDEFVDLWIYYFSIVRCPLFSYGEGCPLKNRRVVSET